MTHDKHSVLNQQDNAINEFREAVAKAAPPELEVTALEDGFDVVYREEFTQKGLLMRIDSTFRVVVRCDSIERSFTMTDRGMVSQTELGGLRRSVSGFSGRMNSSQTLVTWGTKSDGSWGKVGTLRQDTRILHAAVREPAAAMAWTEREPTTAKIGKWIGIVTGSLVVISAIVVGIIALAGGLS